MNYEFNYDGDTASFIFPDEQIKVKLERLMESSRLPLTGEITVNKIDGDDELHLHNGRLGLTSTTAKASIVKALKEYDSYDIDWKLVIELVCAKTKERYRQGEPLEEIWPSDDIPNPQYLLEPLLPLNQPTVIFGDGASCKSLLAMLQGIIVQLPYKDNNLGLIARDQSTITIYGDYEASKDEFELRVSGLCKGLGREVGLYRLPMAQPVADNIEQIKNRIKETKAGFLIIDSLAGGAGGNINEPEPAIRLYSALRKLDGVTTLIVAHNSKDPLTRTKSIFGSVFFTNLARSVWECKISQTAGDSEAIISLKHTKSNRKLHLPLGFRFTFEDNIIKVNKQSLENTELSTELPIKHQIISLLKSGAKSTKDIAEETGIPEGSIITTLNRYKGKLFVKVLDEWGIVVKDYG